MSGEDLQTILGRITETQEEVASIFEISLGIPESTRSILDQANQALVALSMETVRDACRASFKAERLASRNQQLKELAERDALTGLYNRAYLDTIIEKEFEWAKERGVPMSLVFCDIDNFKVINDKYGAGVISERVRQAVASETRGLALGKSVHVTVSVGYATQSPEGAIRRYCRNPASYRQSPLSGEELR